MAKKPQKGAKRKPSNPQIQATPTKSTETASLEEAVERTHLSVPESAPDNDTASAASEQTPARDELDEGVDSSEPVEEELETELGAHATTSVSTQAEAKSREDISPFSTPRLNGVHAADTTGSSEKSHFEDIIATLRAERDSLLEQVETIKGERDLAQEQYSQLRGKVSKITAQLSTKIHNYENTISDSNERIIELENSKVYLEASVAELERRINTIALEKSQLATEVDLLRSRGELSRNNWAKEREELVIRERRVLDDLRVAEQARQDWEVLAMEERAQREALSDRLAEYEEQLSAQREALLKSQEESQTNDRTVADLQRALSEVQAAHRSEFRDRVEKSEEQIIALKKQLSVAEEAARTATLELQAAKAEIAEKAPLEKELKDKRLQIGKLRHEAVILNDHLIKALRFLKQRKPEEMVDREIVTNHFLHFLALDRADPKKFQVLQLIAALLSWSDEEKEHAGLFRPGTAFSSNLPRTPSSIAAPSSGSLMSTFPNPFRRPSSTHSSLEAPQNQPGHMPPPSPSFLRTPSSANNRESLAELWSAFLEREANEGSDSVGGSAGAGRETSALSVSSRGGVVITSPSDAIASQPSDAGNSQG